MRVTNGRWKPHHSSHWESHSRIIVVVLGKFDPNMCLVYSQCWPKSTFHGCGVTIVVSSPIVVLKENMLVQVTLVLHKVDYVVQLQSLFRWNLHIHIYIYFSSYIHTYIYIHVHDWILNGGWWWDKLSCFIALENLPCSWINFPAMWLDVWWHEWIFHKEIPFSIYPNIINIVHH